MKHLTIVRLSSTLEGTFGVFMEHRIPFAVTLERPWLLNRRNLSCIPSGRYVCRRVESPRFGPTFEVTDVPGRTHILFHKGNLDSDSEGCILVGERFDHLRGKPGILDSRHGFEELLLRLAGEDRFELIVRWIPGSLAGEQEQ